MSATRGPRHLGGPRPAQTRCLDPRPAARQMISSPRPRRPRITSAAGIQPVHCEFRQRCSIGLLTLDEVPPPAEERVASLLARSRVVWLLEQRPRPPPTDPCRRPAAATRPLARPAAAMTRGGAPAHTRWQAVTRPIWRNRPLADAWTPSDRADGLDALHVPRLREGRSASRVRSEVAHTTTRSIAGRVSAVPRPVPRAVQRGRDARARLNCSVTGRGPERRPRRRIAPSSAHRRSRGESL